jgi:ABC-type phosphate/phosphonate transport system ATPase subunit
MSDGEAHAEYVNRRRVETLRKEVKELRERLSQALDLAYKLEFQLMRDCHAYIKLSELIKVLGGKGSGKSTNQSHSREGQRQTQSRTSVLKDCETSRELVQNKKEKETEK